jgi:hypothetical protein
MNHQSSQISIKSWDADSAPGAKFPRFHLFFSRLWTNLDGRVAADLEDALQEPLPVRWPRFRIYSRLRHMLELSDDVSRYSLSRVDLLACASVDERRSCWSFGAASGSPSRAAGCTSVG